MSFMKKDVNLGLLVLIVASIALFAGFSVYYQSTFRDISMDYKNKLNNLSKVTQELGIQKQKLNETYSMRVKAEQDIKTLDKNYREINDENEKLNSDNTNLRLEVSSTKSELGEKSARLEATQSLLTQTQSSLSAANSKITSLTTRVSNLEGDIKGLCTKLIAAGGSDSDCST